MIKEGKVKRSIQREKGGRAEMVPVSNVLFGEADALTAVLKNNGSAKVLSPSQKSWSPDTEYIYMISQGLLKVYLIDSAGNEKFLWLLGGGSLILTFTSLLDKPISVLDYNTLYAIEKRELVRILERGPATFDLCMGQIYERHEASMIRQIENDNERSITRLARLLHYVALLTAHKGTEIHLRRYLTRQDMACYVGIHVTNVSKLLQQLEQTGCLRREGRDIIITDMKRLQGVFEQ